MSYNLCKTASYFIWVMKEGGEKAEWNRREHVYVCFMYVCDKNGENTVWSEA